MAQNKTSNAEILEVTKTKIVLRDIGPWDQYLTITNNAEEVVQDLVEFLEQYNLKLKGRRIFYYDSENELTELVHDGTKFVRFQAPINPDDLNYI